MPRLTRYFIKAAMIYLIAAFLSGIAMQEPLAARMPLFKAIWPTYIHLLVVGWLTQLIFGVAYWMFPRYSVRQPRASERLGWAAFALLNIGLLLRVIGEPWHRIGQGGGALLVFSAVLQLLGAWAFVMNTWPRVWNR
jgi:hypothetical protein